MPHHRRSALTLLLATALAVPLWAAAGAAAQEVVTVHTGTQFADAITSWGRTGNDTEIVLAGPRVSLTDGVYPQLTRQAGYPVPWSSGTLRIVGDGGLDLHNRTVLDVAGRAALNPTLSGTAVLRLEQLAMANMCEITIPGIEFTTALGTTFMSAPEYLSNYMIDTTAYVRTAELTTHLYLGTVQRTKFELIRNLTLDMVETQSDGGTIIASITPFSLVSVSYAHPTLLAKNLLLQSVWDPNSADVARLWADGTLHDPVFCNGTIMPERLAHLETDTNLAPCWISDSGDDLWGDLVEATNLTLSTRRVRPSLVFVTQSATVPPNMSVPTPLRVGGPMIVSGPFNDVPEDRTHVVLNMANATGVFQLGTNATLFVQLITLEGLAPQALPVVPGAGSNASGVASALGSGWVRWADGVDWVKAPPVWMYNVTLLLPAEDYEAVVELALRGTVKNVTGCVGAAAIARANVLTTGITTLQRGTSLGLTPAQGIELLTYTGWGLNATQLVLMPAGGVAPATVANCVGGRLQDADAADSGGGLSQGAKLGLGLGLGLGGGMLLLLAVILLVVASTRYAARQAALASTVAGGAKEGRNGGAKADLSRVLGDVEGGMPGAGTQQGHEPTHRTLICALPCCAIVLGGKPVSLPLMGPPSASDLPDSQVVQPRAHQRRKQMGSQYSRPSSGEDPSTARMASTTSLLRVGGPLGVGSSSRASPMHPGSGGQGSELSLARRSDTPPASSQLACRGPTPPASALFRTVQAAAAAQRLPEDEPGDEEEEEEQRSTVEVDVVAGPASGDPAARVPASSVAPSTAMEAEAGLVEGEDGVVCGEVMLSVGAAASGTRGEAAEAASLPVMPRLPGLDLSPASHVKLMATSLNKAANKVVVHGVLGQGNWGTVYRGVWRGLPVALKTMVFTGSGLPNGADGLKSGAAASSQRFDQAIMEAAIAASVGHRNVVATYYYDIKPIAPRVTTGAGAGLTITELPAGGASSSDGSPPSGGTGGAPVLRDFKLFLVQELCSVSLGAALRAGTLHDPATGQAAQREVFTVLLDVVRGLEYLHGKKIIHGDLKPENVLLSVDTASPVGVVAKLADFGLSACMDPGATHVSNFNSGTPFYVAPEVVNQRRASPASDIYSFGVLMWQLFTGLAPYVPLEGSGFAWSPDFPSFPPTNAPPPAYLAMCSRCLTPEPHARPTASVLADGLQDLMRA